ncbi:type II toxin-antitoxin system VapC family toxin [uncultured Mucilaginibacter sp.]|uniref:type II toxin-antitoxin system VapC family toxin n=1 Tax=uncultured Mucilaginibacter sp. TaxID=797541 RepID=UPI0025DD3574|nr:type II toxin-antitoxin system VapC family toxin [uncultured Mucilaginibacter sp.]
MVILDSCILIEIQRGNPTIINKVYEFEQADLHITPVIVAEFYRGARSKQEFLQCQKLVSKFTILSLNHNVTLVFDDLFMKYSLSHRPAVPDMLIAAAAIFYNASVYTLNTKDFLFIEGLELLS